jgi:hypothetical protein
VAATLAGAVAGCFPDDARARHIAYASEAGAIAAGVLVLALVRPAGDCDVHDQPCIDRGNTREAIGLTLLFGGIGAGLVTLLASEDTQRKTTIVQPGSATAPAK